MEKVITAKGPSGFDETLAPFRDQDVVLDTMTPYIYIGKLVDWNGAFLTLADADVRDSSEGRASKDHYAFEASRHGYRKNRKRVLVRVEPVVSISLLSDVLG